MICDEMPTKFRELVTSFLEKESGKASTAASLVIHKSSKKPVNSQHVNEILRKNKIWNESRFANNGKIHENFNEIKKSKGKKNFVGA